MIKVSEMTKEEYEGFVEKWYHARLENHEKSRKNVEWALNNLGFAAWAKGDKNIMETLEKLSQKTRNAFVWIHRGAPKVEIPV